MHDCDDNGKRWFNIRVETVTMVIIATFIIVVIVAVLLVYKTNKTANTKPIIECTYDVLQNGIVIDTFVMTPETGNECTKRYVDDSVYYRLKKEYIIYSKTNVRSNM